MQLINKIFRAIISIPVNFCCLPLKQAIHLPIHVGANVKFIHAPHKGMIEIRSKHIKRGMIKLGCDKGSFMMGTNSVIDISPQGKIIFLGGVNICSGFRMIVSSYGEVEIGDNVFVNANNIINSNTKIRIEEGVITGWNCQLLDWDGHYIYDSSSKEIVNAPQPITIGKHTWIGAGSTLLKGVVLAPDIIIPANSTITKPCELKNVIWGGIPNKLLKQNIQRK